MHPAGGVRCRGGESSGAAARILTRLVAAVLAVVLLIAILGLTEYPVEYVRRVLVWQVADVDERAVPGRRG